MTTNIQNIALHHIDGKDATLGGYDGSVLLVVNVASKCGLTPQYEGLQRLYKTYHDKGFEVLGFPSNDFGGQEPGTPQEIQDFCSTKYDVDFPMFEKVAVLGSSKHPLYSELVAAQPRATESDGGAFRERMAGYGVKPEDASEVLWNFEKFLIDRKGDVVGRFAPGMTPQDPVLTGAIEAALAK